MKEGVWGWRCQYLYIAFDRWIALQKRGEMVMVILTHLHLYP